MGGTWLALGPALVSGRDSREPRLLTPVQQASGSHTGATKETGFMSVRIERHHSFQKGPFFSHALSDSVNLRHTCQKGPKGCGTVLF